MFKPIFFLALLSSSALMASTPIWQEVRPNTDSKRIADGTLNSETQQDMVQQMIKYSAEIDLKIKELKKYQKDKGSEGKKLLSVDKNSFPDKDIIFFDKELGTRNKILSKSSLQKLLSLVNVDSQIKIIRQQLEQMTRNMKTPGSQILVNEKENKWWDKEKYLVLQKAEIEEVINSAKAECDSPLQKINEVKDLYKRYNQEQASK